MTYPEEASWDLYEMFQAFLQAPSYHLIFEAALIVWIIRLLFTKSYRLEKSTVLTEREKAELLAEWQPEPLVPDVPHDHPVLQDMTNRVVDSKIGKYVTVSGKECLNLASLNFLGMVGRTDIEDVAVKALRKYGVGSCGPRGFYGTVDVHLELEDRLAKFMKVEEAIIYSYGFATIASAIPAYSKRGDVIFCDEGVSFAIQKGLLASRSNIKFFKHNDMQDLERLLMEQQAEDKKTPKKAKVTRRFLVVEGLYMNYGDMCPLPKLVELKYKYKVRIFMDETISFGTIGATGRGVTEHLGVNIDDIDLLAASLENAIGSIGGFCCGRAYVIDHQRLSGQGYCFSASQPPMLAATAISALDSLEQSPSTVTRLQENSQKMHEQLSTIPQLKVSGEPIAPIKHITPISAGERGPTRQALYKIVQKAETEGIALTVASYLDDEELFPPPVSIRIAVSADLTPEDIVKATKVLSHICDTVLN